MAVTLPGSGQRIWDVRFCSASAWGGRVAGNDGSVVFSRYWLPRVLAKFFAALSDCLAAVAAVGNPRRDLKTCAMGPSRFGGDHNAYPYLGARGHVGPRADRWRTIRNLEMLLWGRSLRWPTKDDSPFRYRDDWTGSGLYARQPRIVAVH